MRIKLDALQWLIGQWEGIQDNGIYHEEWEKISDDEFKGNAYLIRKGELSNPEKLKIRSDDKGIYYIADVSHNPGPVIFTLAHCNDNTFTFENLNHDFPKIITYERKSENELSATISAEVGNKTKKVEFLLRKI